MVLALVLLPTAALVASNDSVPLEPHRLPAADHAGQGEHLRDGDAGGRPPRDPLADALHRAYRLARAVPARRLCHRHRRGLRRGEDVRRVVRAGRLLRRHGDGRKQPQPAGRPRKRCRCATPSRCCSSSRSACCSIRTSSSKRRSPLAATVGDHRRRQGGLAWAIVRAFRLSNSTALAVAAGRAQIGEFSFILIGLGHRDRADPAAGARPDPGRRHRLDRGQSAAVRPAGRGRIPRAASPMRRNRPRR